MLSAYSWGMGKSTKSPNAKSVGKEENDRLRTLAAQLLREKFGGNQTAMAAALGVSQGMVSDFLASKKGAGVTVLRALERIASTSSLAGALQRGLSDPFPSRQVVLALARGAGADESVLAALAADAPATHDDPGEDHWHKRLVELEGRRARMAADLGRGKA
jgi:transcriptional regulator with XRE-family HTH domain